MKLKNHNKEQEARNFIGKKGPGYISIASEQEKHYFEGILYQNGEPNLSLISPECLVHL